jgi:hypothetical protein
MRSKKKPKGHGIHKGVLQEIIKLVLMKGIVTKPELVKAITDVRPKNIDRELAKHRNGGVLSISSTRGGNGQYATVSLNCGLKEAFASHGELSTALVERWSSALAEADSIARRFMNKAARFASTSPHDCQSQAGKGLAVISGNFASTSPHDCQRTAEASLEGANDTKTPLVEGNFAASSISNRSLFVDLKEKAKNIVKDNQRSRNSIGKCVDKSPAKQGQQTVSGLCEGVEWKPSVESVNALQKRLLKLCEGVEWKQSSDTNLREAVQGVLYSMSENMINLSSMRTTCSTKPSKPCLELPSSNESATQPVQEALTPEPGTTMAQPKINDAQPIETDEPAKPKRGRKPKASGERKIRKSRHGESGSFPNSALPIYEDLSLQFRHPIYEGKDSQTLDLQFSRDYSDAIRKCDSDLPFYNTFLKISNTFAQLKDSGHQPHIHKARLRADSLGARYEDYLEAIFESYWRIYEKFEGTPDPPPKYPQPKQLYGMKAQQYYEIWIGNQTNIPYRRYEDKPEYWPENYTGKDYQINYYTKMMDAIRILCRYRHMHINLVLNDLICQKIMSREFAEDPDMNRLLPGYKYSLAA